MLIYVSLLVALIGLLLYYISGNPKHQEVGRLAFFGGLLVFLLQVGGGRAVGLGLH